MKNPVGRRGRCEFWGVSATSYDLAPTAISFSVVRKKRVPSAAAGVARHRPPSWLVATSVNLLAGPLNDIHLAGFILKVESIPGGDNRGGKGLAGFSQRFAVVDPPRGLGPRHDRVPRQSQLHSLSPTATGVCI